MQNLMSFHQWAPPCISSCLSCTPGPTCQAGARSCDGCARSTCSALFDRAVSAQGGRILSSLDRHLRSNCKEQQMAVPSKCLAHCNTHTPRIEYARARDHLCSILLAPLQTAARGLSLTADQLAAASALSNGYHERVAAIKSARQQQVTALHSPSAAPGPPIPELSSPHQAALIKTTMARLANGCALQQQAYLHLTRTFALQILTPFQAGMLCSAFYPYLVEFPAVLSHVLSQAA